MTQPLMELELVGVNKQLAYDGAGKIAVGLLGQHQVAVFRFDAQECQLIFVTATPFELARISQQQARLPDKIERNIGEPQVFLDCRCMTYQFSEPLPEYEAGVRKLQLVVEVRGAYATVCRCGDGAHSVFTASGIS